MLRNKAEALHAHWEGPLEVSLVNLYRYIFGAALVLALMGMLGAPGAAAQSDAKKPGAAAESVERFKDAVIHAAPQTTPEGYEKGNLGEKGAKELLTDANFDAALVESADRPVFIFKHSTQCEISGGAYRRIAKWLDEKGEDAPPLYLVKVIERRPVSQKIAGILKVKHESPQLILMAGKKSVWDASHAAIDAAAIEKALASVKKDNPH